MSAHQDKKLPPTGSTGVVRDFVGYRYSLDWLRYSVNYSVHNHDLLPLWDVFEWNGVINECSPLPNYNHVAKLTAGRIDWNIARPEQKKLVTLTGSDLQTIVNGEYNVALLLAHASQLQDLSVTRLDFAVDCYGFGAIPMQIFNRFRAGKCITRAKTCHKVEEYGEEKKLGETIYIGSRTSQKYLRVYDKGMETRTFRDWVRIELELHDDYAQAAFKTMLRHGIIGGGKAVLRKYITTGEEWFDNATKADGEGIYVDKVEQKETDWERWVRAVCVPAVQEAIRKRVPGVREDITKTIKQALNHGKPGEPKGKP